MSLVISRLGMNIGVWDEIMLLLDRVDKVKHFICETNKENWMLMLVIWCSDKEGFRNVQDIWLCFGMEVVKGVSELGVTLMGDLTTTTDLISASEFPFEGDVTLVGEVLPHCLQVMHSRDKSYVVERIGYAKWNGTKPVDIVSGLSKSSMFCLSATDPGHAPFVQSFANKELITLMLKLSFNIGEDEFANCTRKSFELRLAGGCYHVMVARLTLKSLQQILSYASRLGISPLPLLDGPPKCSWCAVEDANNRCTGCRVACYCNKICQRRHWRAGHKSHCNK